jgi:ketosteroid isomerase-like protein
MAAIRSLRLASNQAILRHDIAAFLPAFADDAVFTWSNGSSAVGKPALEAFFAHDFADPNFIAYVRTPKTISVSDTGARAAEHGTWTALKKGTRYGGDYFAHWMRKPEGWRVQGEVYVKLYCSGSLCTP